IPLAEPHRQVNALPLDIDRDDAHAHAIPDADDVAGVLYESVRKLGDVHQAVLMDPDVDECTEGDDVRHRPLERHSLLQVGDLVDVVTEGRGLEPFARVTARLPQLGEDVA